MTAIVGLVDGKKVWIGGDSAGVAGHSLAVRRDPKVFIKDGFLFGFTSSFRMGDLLRYKFVPPKWTPSEDAIDAFMRTDFIDSIRGCLKDGGFARKKEEQESGGTFLVGHRGRLFCIEDDFQVGERTDGFDAVGCGFELALGSLFSTKTQDPEKRILIALTAAERYSAGVRGPFNTLSL